MDAYADFATEMRIFARHRGARRTATFLVPVDGNEITAYTADLDLSGELMSATTGYMREALRVYAERGQHVRCLFPLIAKGDPFHEVYLMDG